MPFIHAMVSTDITPQQEARLKDRLYQAIPLLPGKSEAYLMVRITPGCRLYFQGTNHAPVAFTEVKLFGKSTPQAYQALTAEICAIMQDVLGITPDRTYVQYEETPYWGHNGRNF